MTEKQIGRMTRALLFVVVVGWIVGYFKYFR